ncbi:MAG: hypothetical protein HLUCCA12_09390 [Rhodobacteraceae bacterium HLUCCA12]|nr:MAG: hypothetical protein HLUCCA12_09390 [Rhodobacteraceae bacterium HLUCCA12]
MTGASNPNGPYGFADGIQIPSAATCKLFLFRENKFLSTASGFMIESEDWWYLVTALHNFTGRNYFSRKCISETLAIPNRFEARVTAWGEGSSLTRFDLRGEIFSDGVPIFLYDWSQNGGDIAVIKLAKTKEGVSFVTMNDVAFKNWTAFAGLEAFALGYPSGLDVNGTPIWKRVSIASEPSQKIGGFRKVLTDGLTYQGMSGGPVIINQCQGFTDDREYLIGKEMLIRVLGVYGGRIEADKERSGTLGFYWPIETVWEIIAESRQVGSIECD